MSMEQPSEFCTLHGLSFVHLYGITLLDKQSAVCYCRYLHGNGSHILGVDGFFLIDGDKLQPSLEHSIDITCEQYRNKSQSERDNELFEFINSQPENIYF